MNRIGSAREDWPFQPWPARRGNTLGRWGDDMPVRGTAISHLTAGRWLLLALVPVLVVGLAGVAVARLVADDAGSEASSENSRGDSACSDRHVAALVREHRRAVRGL